MAITRSSLFSQLPSFLLPAFSKSSIRRFSRSSPHFSRIGKTPIVLPPSVSFKFIQPSQPTQQSVASMAQAASIVEVEGPQGRLALNIPPFVTVEEVEGGNAQRIGVLDPTDKVQKAMWGTVRALLQNHVLGVSEGHSAILRLVGVGYRATVEDQAVTKSPEYPGQKFVSLKVGYSHPIELGVPEGVRASTPQPTRILLEGCEKQVVMHFAAQIREWRKPEPYKGKGIFVNDETVRLKSKKIN